MVGHKWIYKIKTCSNRSIERYKALLVAKGFTQVDGINYEETFALVARISSIRALLAVVVSNKWAIFQMDVKNVFLNGNLSEEVYMHDNALKCILAIYLCGRYLLITMLNLYN